MAARGGKKISRLRTSQEEKGSEEENVSRMGKDRTTRVSKLEKYYLMIMKR